MGFNTYSFSYGVKLCLILKKMWKMFFSNCNGFFNGNDIFIFQILPYVWLMKMLFPQAYIKKNYQIVSFYG